MADDSLDMPQAEATKKKSRPLVLILVLVLVLCLSGGAAYYFMFMDQGVSSMQTTMPAPKPRKAADKKAVPKTGGTAAESAPAKVEIPSYGDLEYASLDAQLKTLEKKVQLQTKQNELQELILANPFSSVGKKEKGKDSSISPEDLRRLISQEMDRQKEKEPAPAPAPVVIPREQPEEERASIFVSIQGVGNNMAVSVRDESGGITQLKKGSSYRGGKIVKITRSGVTVEREGNNVFYPF